MRHRKKRGRLSRNISHRKAMLKNMATSVLLHQRIETTTEKAKAVRPYVEKLITLAKKDKDPVAARRQAFARLSSRQAVLILFKDLAPLFKDIPGGYTRIMPTGIRKGDGAPMAIIELTKRTISDDDLMGITKKTAIKKALPKKGKAAGKAGEAAEGAKAEEHHSAPDVDIEKKEERAAQDKKREKARTEQKKMNKKGGFFKRFQRKVMD